ncbi:hypothetical protein TWF694_002114 [Orbilia ellipsospora]|uniref:NYN domain-containing protein n=1 Tax=Orbilia ellipsospora TaxID=2528407 RepID=A0AAV9X5Q9_9PEZI
MAAALRLPAADGEETSPFDLSPAIALLHSLSYFHPSSIPEPPAHPAPVTNRKTFEPNLPLRESSASSAPLAVYPGDLCLPNVSRKNPFRELLSAGAVGADTREPIKSVPLKSTNTHHIIKSVPVQQESQNSKKSSKPSVCKLIKLGGQQRRSQPSSKRSAADPASPVKRRNEMIARVQDLSHNMNSYATAVAPKLRKTSDGVHVFVDHSNINIGFFESIKKLFSTGYRSLPNIHLSLDTLVTILEAGRPTEKKVFAGSTKSQILVSDALRLGYEWNYLERVEKVDESNRGYRSDPSSNESPTKRIVEQAVDEIIVLKMYESLFDYAPSTMVLATGDGNSTEFSDGFYGAVQRSLACGWTVQLFAWKRTLSRSWRKIRSPNFKIFLLDDYIFDLIETE